METPNQTRRLEDTRLAVGPWRLGRALGEGASGRVCLGKHQKTGQFAAIKIINKDKTQGTTTSIQEAGCDIQHAIEREIAVMNIPTHPNMIELYEIWDSRDEIYLVLEYVGGGDLLQYMTRKRFLPEKEVAQLFRQLVTGLLHLHQFSVYHRDLKHENLMMDQNGNIKIGDFGMAALQPAGERFMSACGSPNYAAPEVVQGLPYNGSTADIWSSGVILYGMLTHQLPFDDPDTSAILSRIVCAEYKLPRSISSEAADLIRRMLELDPTRRIKLESIFDHPFMTKHQGRIPSIPLDTAIQNGAVRCTSFRMALKEVRQVDMDIVAKLKALWMTQDEVVLANKVLFQESSLERLFYNLLLEKHTRAQSAKVSNDIILKLNNAPPHKLGFNGLSFTKVDWETPSLYRGVSTLVEPVSRYKAVERPHESEGLSLGSRAMGNKCISRNRALGGNNQPKFSHALQSPSAPRVRSTRRELEESYPYETHPEKDGGHQSHILPAEEKKAIFERNFEQLNVLKACLKVLSRRDAYRRKVRRSQSRRSVVFAGSQPAVGNGDSRRLQGLGKETLKTAGVILSTDGLVGCEVSNRVPTAELEKSQERKLAHEHGVAKDGLEYPCHRGNGR
ncbi:hypothetical protein TWF718_011394 [Orbilia javanica]|uniref:Protein kinase domain-containing protein n=1 Tax=Orbilia javanica TaxID=47235 RepID=A0AAN8MTP1_9PEZI